MAVATWSSSAVVMKAVLLPLILVLLDMAAGASGTEDAPAVAKSGGRFSETPLGRKLLTEPIQACGAGSAPDHSCPVFLPTANKATCCTDKKGNQGCWDVGASWLDKCGSCNSKCKVGSEWCCSGVCANLYTDKNNCGICGHKCGQMGCKMGMCNY